MPKCTILAIETSCDDTGVAILRDNTILANILYGQEVHAQFGGVVPEEASRQHMQNLMPAVQAALAKSQLTLQDIDAIAFTQKPGLIGSLMVGCSFAKSLAQVLSIPLIAVHHMEAHVLSNLIGVAKPEFPFLCLTVSGGHTQLVVCESPLEQRIIGATIDDAAGEAFDKAAKMLGLSYPGGPLIDKYAQQGDASKFSFAEPQMQAYDFSFSGLKTSILYFLQKEQQADPNFITSNLQDLCASIQATIVQILMKKLIKASKELKIKNISIAGGVSANSGLRKAVTEAAKKYKWQLQIPAFEYCTDNAAMIAQVAYYKYLAKEFVDLQVEPSAR